MPYKIDDQEGNESITKNCLNEFASILSLCLGNNFLHSIVYDAEMAFTDKGSASITGHSIELPQKCDGPFLSQDDCGGFLEILQKINEITDLTKINQVSLALQFFQTGKNTFNDNSALLFYWIAIVELLGISKTKKINEKLRVLYSMNAKEVEDKLLWKWAYTTRNNLMHQGKLVVFNANIESYFQLLFLDLLRGELWLECKKFLGNYLNSNPDFVKMISHYQHNSNLNL